MRFILVDHARKRRYQKRGGDQQIVALDMDVADVGAESVLRIDDALSDLAKVDQRKARVVELRVFAGLSVGGGSEPAWRRDGHELFYLAPNGGLMSVALTAADVVNASRPTELFRTQVPRDSQSIGTSYAASADGRRFLVPTAVGDPPQAAITVVLNWVKAVER